MSYAAISTTHHIGEKRLPGLSGEIRFLSGLRGLGCCAGGMGAMGQGSVTQADLEDAGVDPGIATTLLAMGATDAQLEAVINDPDSYDAAIALLQQMTGTGAQAAQSSAPSRCLPPSSPAALSPGPPRLRRSRSKPRRNRPHRQIICGGRATRIYAGGGSLSFSEAISTWTWTSVVAQLNAYLQQRSGIIITGTNASGNPLSLATGFSATVQLWQPYTNALW